MPRSPHPRNRIATILALGFLSIVSRPSAAECDVPSTSSKLNVVVILIDDLGATDLGCTGSKFFQTPHIDRLAAQGMRFTQAYSACTVCSPTRASLQTGQYPARLHITDYIPGERHPFAKLKTPAWTLALPADTVTLALRLKTAGYATASLGKWHLGGPESAPEKFGYDVNFAGDHRGQPPSYFYPYKIPNVTDGKEGEYLTDRITTEAENFIEQHRDQPFFVYVPHYAVHTPLQAKQEIIDKYRAAAKADQPQKNAIYAAMIESVDESVGRILAKLDALHLAEKTLVIFHSDNGGLLGSTTNLGMRAGKGSAYEGGVRVPLIVRWPNVVKAGTICDTPVITLDLYPTILAAAAVSDAPGHVVDGADLSPLLKQTGSWQREAIFWHYPHYHSGGATPHSVIRRGDEKLIEFFEDDHVELYDLKADPLEQHDLSTKNPAHTAELLQQLKNWRTATGAQLPEANPNYDPTKLKRPATAPPKDSP